MRVIMSLSLMFALSLGGALIASPQAEESLPADAVCTPAPAPDDANSASLEGLMGQSDAHRHIWHCTAYPEGHHQHGYSYSDEHYSHARSGAINLCERMSHHHCHDVHCHQD